MRPHALSRLRFEAAHQVRSCKVMIAVYGGHSAYYDTKTHLRIRAAHQVRPCRCMITVYRGHFVHHGTKPHLRLKTCTPDENCA